MEKITATISETAKALGLGRTKVYELIKQKKLESIKIGTRRLVKVSSIQRLVDPANRDG